VIHVTDRADVHVRLGPFEFTFSHDSLLSKVVDEKAGWLTSLSR
jgi:hypothetical protein